jgi:8-oxo-dGTP diphosphatase
MSASAVTPIAWTSDGMPEEGLHYLTLHYLVTAESRPRRLERDKIDGWSWQRWEELPEPLFAPIAHLQASGWQPPR